MWYLAPKRLQASQDAMGQQHCTPLYTPAHHFEEGKADPGFRAKPKIALELLETVAERDIPFRAVVAGIFYGEHRGSGRPWRRE